MKVVIGLDWSEDALAALRIVTDQFLADRLTLVHAVDLGPFKSPLFSTVVYQAFEGYKAAVEMAAQELLDSTTAKIPSGMGQVERILLEGKPSNVILDAARKQGATLLAVGTRGRNRMAESILGSVSHHIVMKAPCPVLIARAPAATIERLIVGVEAFDDGHVVLIDWLRVTPFRKRPSVHVVSAVPAIQLFDPVLAPALQSWPDDSLAMVRRFVEDIVQKVSDLGYAATGVALQGDPARSIINEAGTATMILVASHARRGVERLLLGSVSHAIVHLAPCPVVVVPLTITH